MLGDHPHTSAGPRRALVGLEGVGLGLAKFLSRPSTLPDPLSDDRDLPRV